VRKDKKVYGKRQRQRDFQIGVYSHKVKMEKPGGYAIHQGLLSKVIRRLGQSNNTRRLF